MAWCLVEPASYTDAMRGKILDPQHLDIRVFADRSASLEGDIALPRLQRLAASFHADAPPGDDELVHWRAGGEMRKARGAPAQPWLDLTAQTRVRLTCQRCLQAVEVPLHVDADFRFVTDESTAADQDVDAEEDLLVESRSFNLHALIEDEMLLALPLVPRHDGDCPQPLQAPADPAAAAIELEPRDKPFAALAGLKLRKRAD